MKDSATIISPALQLVGKTAISRKNRTFKEDSGLHSIQKNNTGFSFSQQPIFSYPAGFYSRIQAKLAINTPGDKYEQEADAMADKVMRMEMPGNKVQRKCAHCEEEEKKKLQRKESGSATTQPHGALETYVSGLNNGGQSLSTELSSFYEQRMGYDFSKVRIHNDTAAAQSAQGINALAYTHGNNIVFNSGQYSPHSNEGKRLLAHELAHVVQQTPVVSRKPKEDSEVTRLKTNIAAGAWKESFEYLNGLWMKIMLEKLNGLSETEIDGLSTNAEKAKNAPGAVIGENGKNRCLAGILSVKSAKNGSWPDTEIEKAAKLILPLPIDQRKEIFTFLKASKSKAAKKLSKIIGKPLQGYTASAFDFSDRFLKHADKLGFATESTTKSLPTTAWTGDDPDPQTTHTTDSATKSFENSDIVFFSGHQYAQYKRPGLYTNDSSSSCFNIGAISKKINKVKLVASTSCATICKDVAKIYTAKFPNALVLGYKYSAPLDGGKVSKSFTDILIGSGPIDLTNSAGLKTVREAWKSATTSNPGVNGQPGILFADEIEYYNGKAWKKAKSDSKENECHYH